MLKKYETAPIDQHTKIVKVLYFSCNRIKVKQMTSIKLTGIVEVQSLSFIQTAKLLQAFNIDLRCEQLDVLIFYKEGLHQ